MIKSCDVCHKELEDEDEIVAAVVTVFHKVPSSVVFAVERPTDCLRMIHMTCYERYKESNDETTV